MGNNKRLSFGVWYGGRGLLLLGCLLVSARVGAVSIAYDRIFLYLRHALGGGIDGAPIEERLFLQIRLPRVLLCAFTGATLSVSGALMQALFRNPIVEPGLVGTSAGAALGAAFVFVMGKSIAGVYADVLGPYLLPIFAFLGGFLATLIV